MEDDETGLTANESRPLPTLLDEAALERVAGVLVGLGVGDALGVPYEFNDVRAASAHPPEMLGGGLGPYAPGEYSDDTQMAVCIAGVMASRNDPSSRKILDGIGAAFLHWAADGASDMGNLTARVLTTAINSSGFPTSNLGSIAGRDYREHDQSAGNGALMRTAPVALWGLALEMDYAPDCSERRELIARAARLVAGLTHADPLAGDSCVLWCEAIRVAVLEERLDMRAGLDLLPEEREEYHRGSVRPRSWWERLLDEADPTDSELMRKNGSTFGALRAAWSAIGSTTGSGEAHIRAALEKAINWGHDTDTVAAIAGSLLGARWGVSAMPEEWLRMVHGWSGVPDRSVFRAADLARLGLAIARGGSPSHEAEALWKRLAGGTP